MVVQAGPVSYDCQKNVCRKERKKGKGKKTALEGNAWWVNLLLLCYTPINKPGASPYKLQWQRKSQHLQAAR